MDIVCYKPQRMHGGKKVHNTSHLTAVFLTFQKIKPEFNITVGNKETKYRPRLPTQHLAASKSGEWRRNFWVAGSYFAMVLIPLALEPCDISVKAKQPKIWKKRKKNIFTKLNYYWIGWIFLSLSWNLNQSRGMQRHPEFFLWVTWGWIGH